MKKKILSLLLILALCLALTVSVGAAGIDRMTDSAGLLSEEECTALNEKLDAISDELNFDLVVVTVESLQGWDVEDASWYLYDENGFRENGAILLISMEERDWTITSCGWGQTALNGDARSYLADLFVSDLSAGNYARAFNTFADGSRELVLNAASGVSYKAPFNLVPSLLISLAVGLILALIVVGGMKKKLKSVAAQYAASEYVAKGSLNVTEANERFLYHTVSRTAKPQNENRSSGGSHSSTSGKF